MKKFKTIKTPHFPHLNDSRDCPVCGESLEDGQFIINVGGFPTKGKPNIMALFSIIRHFHDEKDVIIDVIDGSTSQVDMLFCSKKCVVNFFKKVLKRLND